MDDEQLIELVRRYPVLYDLSHSKYMDSKLKLDIWSSIGKELKVSGASCKSRWNNIRDNYRKSLKKLITKSGQGVQKNKTYKYSQQLGFLNKYFEDRETKGNIESQLAVGDDNDQESLSDGEESTESRVHADLEIRPSPSPSPKITTIPKDTEKSIAETRKRKKQAPQQTATAKLMEYLVARNDDQAVTSTQHPVDAFLTEIAPTLKTLNPFYLNLAKSEIFNIVQQYEMKMLQEQHSHHRVFLNLLRSVTPQSDQHSISSNSTPIQLLSPAEIPQEHPVYQGQHEPPALSSSNVLLPNYFEGFKSN
ncbi:madf domain transcription factor [Holotrichia oblita]|uniref:Madf domain transcription factor n=1 Tax=Holotrichia oblita TaxID=644536 RepID=A0ACB9TTI6_HOLOL|nr:madf domain transcription factor [Holotrichia oblita]